MKHVKKLAIIAIVALTGIVVLAGCFGSGSPSAFAGVTPTAEQLHGRWEMTEIHTTGVGRHTENSAEWSFGYFVNFDANGNFKEKDYWNYEGETTATWALDGNTLTLTNPTQPAGAWFVFVGTRTVQITEDGQSLRITYKRTQSGSTWTYTQTYVRAA